MRMESKYGIESKIASCDVENKRDDKDEEDGWCLPGVEDGSVVAKAAGYFARKKKLSMLADFAKENWRVFQDEVGREAEEDGTGFKFEYDECHQKFLRLFEEELEAFIREEGFSMDDFRKDLEDIRKGKSVTLFDNEDHSWFLDALLSSIDYSHFHKTMVQTAARERRKCKK